MRKLNWKYRILTFGLLNIILLSSPMILLSSPKPMGIINIFRQDAFSEKTVKVNGLVVISGQIITSPSIIETPFGTTELMVTLGEAGRIKFGSDTKMNLAFDANKIFGVLLKGSVAVSVQPYTTLNIQTKDGFITVLNENQKNDLVIDFVGSKTQVKTFTGLATLNGASIAAGQYFIVGELNVKNVDLATKPTFFNYFIVSTRLIISSLLRSANSDLNSDLNIDNNQTTVGPVR